MQRELTGRETVNWQTNRSHEVVSLFSLDQVQRSSRGGRVFLGLAKLCKRTLQPVRRSAVGLVLGAGQQCPVPCTQALSILVSSSAAVLLCSLCCWASMGELRLNTDWQNENRFFGSVRDKASAGCGSTRLTVGSKLGAFEFRLACYQWGNSWCLYSFCLIRRRLGLALFSRATIGSACE